MLNILSENTMPCQGKCEVACLGKDSKEICKIIFFQIIKKYVRLLNQIIKKYVRSFLQNIRSQNNQLKVIDIGRPSRMIIMII